MSPEQDVPSFDQLLAWFQQLHRDVDELRDRVRAGLQTQPPPNTDRGLDTELRALVERLERRAAARSRPATRRRPALTVIQGGRSDDA